MRSDFHVVWFKKDLRVTDHMPLHKATQRGPTVGLYILEDTWLQSDEFSPFHLRFLSQSLLELERDLKKFGIPLLKMQGNALDVLQSLKAKLPFQNLYSHEETGLNWTFQRDINVRKWCREQSIHWHEESQFAVVRGLKNRDHWAGLRKRMIEREIIPLPQSQSPLSLPPIERLPSRCEWVTRINPKIQMGGRTKAWQTLCSFFSYRGLNYRTEMSSPNTAFDSCSRISPYLAWGNLSLTEVTHQLRQAQHQIEELPHESTALWRKSLKSFESRLWWHCHFIQKLESEPEIEFQNMNRGFDGMREFSFDNAKFEAWKKGETGFPMIDASMRALRTHGWINFRMRAMLVSFASYQLWLHWRKPAQYLASLFTDFEPGIHFSQVQMQSGVTGINTIRIYSPTKQGLDQDPEGKFIKQFCPELEGLGPENIHQPHLVPPLLQTIAGVKIGVHYPEPIVDPTQSYREAKEKIYQWRKKQEVNQLARKVYERHGSRKTQEGFF